MKFERFIVDRELEWGFYITPVLGFTWNAGYKRIWFGFLFWLFIIDLKRQDTGTIIWNTK